MARPAGSKDVAPVIRGAFKRALLSLEGQGKPLSGMIEEHLESDFLNTLKVIAQFTPKEIEGTIEQKRSRDDFTDDQLQQLIASASSADTSSEAESSEPFH